MRFHFLDFSRAVLFSLGIVLHAAWFCQDQSEIFWAVHTFIHSFRMQSFFLIAGFFSAMTLTRYSAEHFLRKRLQRLGIPFLFCGLVLDSIINLPNHSTWTDLSIELSRGYWMSGGWLQHLWFLGTLIVYVLALYGAQKLWPRMDPLIRQQRLGLPSFLGLVALVYFGCTHLQALFPSLPWERFYFFLHPDETLKHAAFFLAGYYLFHHQDLLEDLCHRPAFNLSIVICFWLALPLLSRVGFGKYIARLWDGFYGISACSLLLWVAKRLFNNANAVVQSFAEASYTIYLVHWPIMIVLHRVLIPLQLPVGLEFAALVSVTGGLSYAFHAFLIKRSPLLSFLINGQASAKETRPAAQVCSAP
jgi:glucan biosynthesis protein C